MKYAFLLFICLIIFLTGACKSTEVPQNTDERPAGVAVTSLLGKSLYSSTPDPALLSRYNEIKAQYHENPKDPDRLIWLGRFTAYLGRYHEAIDIYSKGIQQSPNDARMYRHRGHRYISIREFDLAIKDLEAAVTLIHNTTDQIEPDGMPNARNIPLSSLHTNIWYHLGLAYYLKNDLDKALEAYEAGKRASRNDDMLTAFTHWQYMTLRQLNRPVEAGEALEPIHQDMEIIENFAYHRLCLLYKGLLAPEALGLEETGAGNDALRYGIANWYFYNGQPEKAVELFKAIVAGDSWASFGYLAAEAFLSRKEK